MMRKIVYLVFAMFLWVLLPEPAKAEQVKFQGWMNNLTSTPISVKRVARQCWDPQQIAYQPIQTGTVWTFASESIGQACTSPIGWISANVLDHNNNLMFWFQMFDNYGSGDCYIFLFSAGTTNPFAALPATGCHRGDTLSFTINVTGGPVPATIAPGLLKPPPGPR